MNLFHFLLFSVLPARHQRHTSNNTITIKQLTYSQSFWHNMYLCQRTKKKPKLLPIAAQSTITISFCIFFILILKNENCETIDFSTIYPPPSSTAIIRFWWVVWSWYPRNGRQQFNIQQCICCQFNHFIIFSESILETPSVLCAPHIHIVWVKWSRILLLSWFTFLKNLKLLRCTYFEGATQTINEWLMDGISNILHTNINMQ